MQGRQAMGVGDARTNTEACVLRSSIAMEELQQRGLTFLDFPWPSLSVSPVRRAGIRCHDGLGCRGRRDV